ncbi:MAG TPA: thermonuclease family protein [Anaerolineae bacterium]|nr:thermonuclease family protein [Anaerolineae bacterium]
MEKEEQKVEISAPTLTETIDTEKNIKNALLQVELPDCINSYAKKEVAYVARVIDGDSIVVIINDKEYEVRYIGINTPEYEGAMVEKAEEATRMNRELVKDKHILLITDISETDKYHRLLRYVFTEDAFINYELVKLGVASAVSYPPDIACQGLFLEAGRKAQKNY